MTPGQTRPPYVRAIAWNPLDRRQSAVPHSDPDGTTVSNPHQTLTHYNNWFSAFPWQWFITTRIPPGISLAHAHVHFIQEVIRPLCRTLHCRIATISVISPGHGLHRPHIHSMALANASLPADDATLQRLMEQLTVTSNRLVNHAGAIDLRSHDASRHNTYAADHITGQADIIYYDRKLLSKLTQGA